MSKEKKESKKEAKEPKVQLMTLTASYKQKNEEDGTFERVTHVGTGANLADCIEDIGEYPKGLACNILITLKRGKNELTRNVAPQKAIAILEKADEVVFESIFRGV